MRRNALLAILFGLVLSLPSIAQAEVVAKINLSSQRMAVFVNGAPRYNWPVSTARSGYRTPTGTFKPTALVRYHFLPSTMARRCRIRFSSRAATPFTGPTRSSISGAPRPMAASGSIPRTPPRSIRSCSATGRGTRSSRSPTSGFSRALASAVGWRRCAAEAVAHPRERLARAVLGGEGVAHAGKQDEAHARPLLAQQLGELLGDLRSDGGVGRALGEEHRRAGRRLARSVLLHDSAPRFDLGRIGFEKVDLIERLLRVLDGRELR